MLAAVLGVSLSVAAPAHGTPQPTNPPDQQIKNAQSAKDTAANDVGAIAARIAIAQSQLQRLNSDAQVAEQNLALTLQRQQQAKDAATKAQGNLQDAQTKVDEAHRQFVEYIQATYMNAPIHGTAGALLTASDPSAVLEQGALQNYSATHQIDAISRLNKATVAKSNADASARGALKRQAHAAAAAQAAQRDVIAALTQAQSQKAVLDSQLAADRTQLQAAQIRLTGLTDQRAAFLAWKKQQEEIAARQAERRRQQQLAQQRAAARAAAQLANQKPTGGNSGGGSGRSSDGGGGSGSSSDGGGGSNAAPAPSGGSSSLAKGRQAVSRAMQYLGMRYSWAAGNYSGPTYGVSEPGAAWNDSNVRGFDCSGLTLYAWAPWMSLDHSAATQYTQAGGYHPSVDNLIPGDLVFWSGDGSIGGIGHEAMYIGGGNVIQAPQSGDVIKITNIYDVESGYFGATRPLT